MIINETQQQYIKRQIHVIDVLDKQGLIEYAQKRYLAKEDLEPSVFNWVQKAIDIKMAELMEIIDISPMAIMSELREDEV